MPINMKIFRKGKKEEKEEKKTEEKAADVGAGEGSVALPKGDDADAYRIIVGPRITEKGSMMGTENKYIFRVAKNANKSEIKKAIGNLYKVEVTRVNVLKVSSKYRRVGRYEGRKPGFKKAIVTLRQGSKIDVAV